MNKVRLVFLVFISLFVVLISFIVLTYSEHDKVSKYGGVVRELGHEVLEMRDHITNDALTEISNPYQMSADLVTLEKELQALKDNYQGENTHSTFFQHLPTLELLDQFHDASMSNVDTLDKLVGLSVARQLLLKSMTTQLTSSKPINYHFGAESDLIIQSELLASVLFSGVHIQHSDVDSDLANLSQTFVELNQQHSLLLSQVLDLHSTEYIEHIEHQFTELQDQLKGVTVKLGPHTCATDLRLLVLPIYPQSLRTQEKHPLLPSSRRQSRKSQRSKISLSRDHEPRVTHPNEWRIRHRSDNQRGFTQREYS
ncbi:exported hypothetical protein [Vibrio coralliirubri]|nr:exported hypothetical protein [Vibrio coralliirubri]